MSSPINTASHKGLQGVAQITWMPSWKATTMTSPTVGTPPSPIMITSWVKYWRSCPITKPNPSKAMKVINLKLYQFKELDRKAKENALNLYRDINVNFNWWESVYEDFIWLCAC